MRSIWSLSCALPCPPAQNITPTSAHFTATHLVRQSAHVRATDAAHGALRLAVGVVVLLAGEALAVLRERMWSLTGLVRVRLRHGDEPPSDPVALPPPVTVADVAHTIHHDIGVGFTAARVWGPSARFDGQR